MILDNLLLDSARRPSPRRPFRPTWSTCQRARHGDRRRIRGFVLAVVTALLSAGATTLQVQVQGSTDNSTFTTYGSRARSPRRALAAGRARSTSTCRVRTRADALPRYLRLNYVVRGPFTGGTVTSALVLGRDDIPVYPPGVVVAN
jgi:hypothetical protein